ncbi:MAG TPA: hypothetical protein VN577_20170 [Terriglobales bacterium]|nr:hypothetical protein [Terriglobales bacterium]
MTEAKAPTAARLDKLCAERIALQTQCESADKKLAAKDAEIMALVNQWGRSPDGSDKSLRLEGNQYQATSIGGVNTEIDQNSVLQLRLALVKNRAGHFFNKLFVLNSKFTLAPNAEAALSIPPSRAPKNLATLFHSCLSFKPKKPRLDVKPVAVKGKAAR